MNGWLIFRPSFEREALIVEGVGGTDAVEGRDSAEVFEARKPAEDGEGLEQVTRLDIQPVKALGDGVCETRRKTRVER